MKQVASAFAMAALAGLAAGAWADEPRAQTYTDADLNGGYACELSGTLGSAGAVGVAQFRPLGDGTFGAAVLGLNVGGLGVCLYALTPGTGTYEVRPDGTGLARATYAVHSAVNRRRVRLSAILSSWDAGVRQRTLHSQG
jgi:hypothetical protein